MDAVSYQLHQLQQAMKDMDATLSKVEDSNSRSLSYHGACQELKSIRWKSKLDVLSSSNVYEKKRRQLRQTKTAQMPKVYGTPRDGNQWNQPLTPRSLNPKPIAKSTFEKPSLMQGLGENFNSATSTCSNVSFSSSIGELLVVQEALHDEPKLDDVNHQREEDEKLAAQIQAKAAMNPLEKNESALVSNAQLDTTHDPISISKEKREFEKL